MSELSTQRELVERDAQTSEQATQMNEPKVAYMMSRFPVLTETFVLFEILAVEETGVQVEIYPLLFEKNSVMHPEARPLVGRAHFQPFISWKIIRANLHFAWHKPRAYFGAMWTLLRGTIRSRRFFIGALGILPKTAYFAQHMRAEKVTHIHAHFASHPAASAFIIHRLVGIPYSFTAHGSDIHRDQTMLAQKVAEASFVVPISSFNKKVILEACNERFGEKLLIIHCGVDTKIFRPSSNGQNSIDSPFNIGCIGTLHEVKGQTHLIEACRILKERGINFQCNFVGDGPDRSVLEEQAVNSGLAEYIKFHGRKTRSEVVSLLQTADVVVAPSVPSREGRREGIPVALMEAMACGLPVVASRLSGIPELVLDEQCGYLTTPGDSLELAGALEHLWQNPERRRKMGQASRDQVLKEFDLNSNATELVGLFFSEVTS